MTPSSAERPSGLDLDTAWRGVDWLALALMLVLAALLRVVFAAGYLGSDDVNSSLVAISLAQGQWATTSTYLASLRYGISIPTALFIRAFGLSEFTVALWPLVCSAGEVGLVFVVARLVWSLRAAVLAALLIALTPIHVLHGGLPTGDAPLAFFITLSVLLFLVAEARESAPWYFATGLAIGFTFWIKEYAIVWAGVFGFYAVVARRWSQRWLWVIAGGAVMLAASILLFVALTGDPLYYLKVIVNRRAAAENYIATGRAQSPWFYVYYLLADLRHTWFVAYLAVGGAALWAARAVRTHSTEAATRYVVICWAGLFAILNFLPIKLQPLTFIFKQTNYMLVFWAPFTLLAGFFLASLRGRLLVAILGITVPAMLVLSALEQQAIRGFTANSRAAWAFAREHPGAAFYATEHTANMVNILPIVEGVPAPLPTVKPLSRLDGLSTDRGSRGPGIDGPFVIIDFETIAWGDDPPLRPDTVPACWHRMTRLEPSGFGAGADVARMIRVGLRALPASASRPLDRRIAALIEPRPAFVYWIRDGCSFSLDRG